MGFFFGHAHEPATNPTFISRAQDAENESLSLTTLSNGSSRPKFAFPLEKQHSRQGCSSTPSRSASVRKAAPCRCCTARRTSETESRTPRNPRNRASPNVPCTYDPDTHVKPSEQGAQMLARACLVPHHCSIYIETGAVPKTTSPSARTIIRHVSIIGFHSKHRTHGGQSAPQEQG